MNTNRFLLTTAIAGLLAALTGCAKTNAPSATGKPADATEIQAAWRENFNVNKANLMPTGANPYLAIQPGKTTTMKTGIDTLTVTIRPETKRIDAVKVGVVEERETKH